MGEEKRGLLKKVPKGRKSVNQNIYHRVTKGCDCEEREFRLSFLTSLEDKGKTDHQKRDACYPENLRGA
jgi:hypothetical protein